MAKRSLRVAVWLLLPAVVKGMLVTLRRFLSRKTTLRYPEERHVPRKGYRGEHRLKKDDQGRMKCVACFMCQTACPAECITIVAGPSPWPDRDKIPVKFDIDMLKCIYCGMCEEACPATRSSSRRPSTSWRRRGRRSCTTSTSC